MNNSSEMQPPKLNNSAGPGAGMLANALILPGLGTVLRGARVGYAQMSLAALGLILSGIASAGLIRALLGVKSLPQDADGAIALIEPMKRDLVMGVIGVLVFVIAWVWSMFSSWQFQRNDRALDSKVSVPPRAF